jgi:diguanylate cyclase
MLCIDTPETVQRYADAAFAAMRRHAIVPTPAHYAIWYEHAAGRNPGLDRALAPIVSGAAAFSATLAEEIHGRFLRGALENDEMRDASGRLQGLVAQVLERISAAGQDNARYSRELVDLTGDLTQVRDAGDVSVLVGNILSATHRVLERNQRLESELSISTSEIDELKQNLEQTRQAALTDSMTGLANRAHFEKRLAEDARLGREAGDALSLLLIDIDFFKRFNDSHGHLIGDEVLKVVARTLKANLKGRDTAARYGGEEFAVILPQTSLMQAVVVGEHIRRALASHCLTNRKTGQNFGTITVSIGVATHAPDEPFADFIDRADQALYRAKRLGRNRVIGDEETARVTAA